MIIQTLKESGLRGRGGAGFPTWQKWQMVKDAPVAVGQPSPDGRGDKKYVVCNVSEGEPDVFKDAWLLEKDSQAVVDGIALAMEAVGAQKGYIYLRKDYFDKYKNKLKKIIASKPIELFREPCGYLGGEETTLLESIEGNRCEPRIKPPFPPQVGLFGCPTLINNLETIYYAAKIAKNEYKGERLYCISGDVKNKGVFEYPADWTIDKVLKESQNYPERLFFVQAGGGGSGTIMLQNELDVPLSGVGAIIVHDWQNIDPQDLMKQWIDFFIAENCGKCVPCREGVYRLRDIINQPVVDLVKMKEILAVLLDTSFCPFGRGVASAFGSLIAKIPID
jgi:NADH:ubiquinone oxidoreductase subunit F (NADH-binding)